MFCSRRRFARSAGKLAIPLLKTPKTERILLYCDEPNPISAIITTCWSTGSRAGCSSRRAFGDCSKTEVPPTLASASTRLTCNKRWYYSCLFTVFFWGTMNCTLCTPLQLMCPTRVSLGIVLSSTAPTIHFRLTSFSSLQYFAERNFRRNSATG